MELFQSTLGKTHERKDKLTYFSRENANQFVQQKDPLSPDLEGLAIMMERLTKELKSYSGVLSAQAYFGLTNNGRYFVNTEGTKIFTRDDRFIFKITVSTLDDRQLIIPHKWRIPGRDLSLIPDYDTLLKIGQKLVKELMEIKEAELEKPGFYPIIMCGMNHGVFWHEVIGHALEGNRAQEDGWGISVDLFRERVGSQITPDFLTIVDDPTKKKYEGHYLFDAEGVPAQKVVLIENGILRNFLHSRESAGYFKITSNGHARADKNLDPIARMANLIVTSSKTVSRKELVRKALEYCTAKGKDYVSVWVDTTGGWTLPEDCFHNTKPIHLFRLYTDGKLQRVRGAYHAGTPDSDASRLELTSDVYGYGNGYCGAESGFVPAIEIAPDGFFTGLQLNRVPKGSYENLREQVLPDN